MASSPPDGLATSERLHPASVSAVEVVVDARLAWERDSAFRPVFRPVKPPPSAVVRKGRQAGCAVGAQDHGRLRGEDAGGCDVYRIIVVRPHLRSVVADKLVTIYKPNFW